MSLEVVDRHELASWRRRLLAPMLGLLVLLTLVFVGASIWQIRDVQARITPPPAAESRLTQLLAELGASPTAQGIAAADLRARIALEDRLLTLRYQHASAVLGSRAWVRFMGFLTGMVLALVGAAFTLGRLETTASQLSGEGGGWKGALSTTSPGLVLATLGTVLMLSAIAVRVSVDVKDQLTYMPATLQVGGATADTAKAPSTDVRSRARSMYLDTTDAKGP